MCRVVFWHAVPRCVWTARPATCTRSESNSDIDIVTAFHSLTININITNPIRPLEDAGKTRPIEKFAAASAKCTTQGAVYGKCVAANYQNVSKDMCVKEFMALKDCYLVRHCLKVFDST